MARLVVDLVRSLFLPTKRPLVVQARCSGGCERLGGGPGDLSEADGGIVNVLAGGQCCVFVVPGTRAWLDRIAGVACGWRG